MSTRDSDDQHDAGEGISRSQRRREALDLLRLAQSLIALSEAQLAQLPLDDALRDEVRRARVISRQIARKRQTQYLAKLLRNLDTTELEPLRAALEHDRALARRETAALHRLETWRERLIEQGDDAFTEFLQQFPHVDRQHLRQLVRQARAERGTNRPPHAYRELLRALRESIGDDAPTPSQD